MRVIQIILILFILFTSCSNKKESNTFIGYWAETEWAFEFNSDNTYVRESWGHYGNTVVRGKYIIQGDTIILTSGFQDTHGTVNEKYLMDGDSCIIDLELKYDYCKPPDSMFRYSRIRKIK